MRAGTSTAMLVTGCPSGIGRATDDDRAWGAVMARSFVRPGAGRG